MSSGELNDTPLTLTLPAYAWAALRGAAKIEAKRNQFRANRPKQLPRSDSINLDADRADTLFYAVGEIEGMLQQEAPELVSRAVVVRE